MKYRFLPFSLFLLLLNAFTPAWSADNAPAFTVTTEKGPLRLEQLRGKVVYLDFWASWCSPCRKSMPWMNDIYARYAKDGLVVLAVNVDSDPQAARRFLDEVPTDFTIGYDPEGEIAALYGLKGMPSSFIIDRDGRLRNAHVGFRDAQLEHYESEIKTLLNESH